MKLGMFMMPLHPPHRALHEIYAEDLDKVLAADRLGFEEVWVGEHFTASAEPIASPFIFMAAALPRTERIRFGTGVINLPNHDPVIVAAEAAQFDQMAKGRFMFGIGPGGLASDFEVFGRDDAKERTARMYEAWEAIRYIWASDPPYDFEGDFYSVKLRENVDVESGIGIMPKPYQWPFPPMALSVMSPSSGSAAAAGARGWIAISANFVNEGVVASHWAKYVEGCGAAGIAPDGSRWRVARNVVIGESDAAAEDALLASDGSTRFGLAHVWKSLKRRGFHAAMKPDPSVPDAALEFDDVLRGLVIHGSAETVTEKLRAFRERVGPFGTLLLAAADEEGRNVEVSRATMTALAREVVPRLGEGVAV